MLGMGDRSGEWTPNQGVGLHHAGHRTAVQDLSLGKDRFGSSGQDGQEQGA